MENAPLEHRPHTDQECAVTEISPTSGWNLVPLEELWNYRDLLYFFLWRDIKVRYKQTVLGVGWALLQPFMTMLVFSVFFGWLARIPSNDLPYPIFAYCALLPWQLFAHSLTEASNSLVNNERLVTKVYFPRLVLPLSAILAGLVDFAIAAVLLVAMMLFYGISPGLNIVFLPLFIGLDVVTALAVGLWLSALNVQYRDVRYTLVFITQIWFYASPVAYSATIVPPYWQSWYGLNPMVGVIEGFRWALLGMPLARQSLVVSACVSLLMLLFGFSYFRRMERRFADLI